MKFKDRFKKLRKENSLTQKELGEKIGISEQAVSNYERGNRNPDHSMLTKIANFFDCSIDYLLGQVDQRNPNTENKKANKIKQALEDDEDLQEFWEQLSTREDLKLMFKQTKDLSPESIHRIIEIVKIIEDEERERHGG
ncbi:helix-turn-helix domain-containing protein [Sporohalobacter salinus]|uniref:helix-turn-helix domain-containing protein n=1 Tax=Sporohalobacter salinus TaxID=1494606 RepID=UPI00195F392B|nr:helix-turn-helix domain-containing protein [Sporohalobacter salinus]MBM7624752.1 transcriptional regulator with XRE-family HTH domain [Sporohalobacter salinus]